jgi:hypothetical protein
MRLAAHINDAGVTLLRGEQIVYREPGFALLDQNLTTGSDAFARSRIDPRRVQHRYWTNLGTEPLAVQNFGHLTAADLASRQLEQMWAAAGNDARELVLAVPASMQAAELGLLLGIARELGLPVVAMVDAAIAATRRQYKGAVPVHVDVSLHATTLTRIVQPGRAQFDRAEVLEDCGLYALYDAWLHAIAEAFVQQSRFDPLHTAETEQMVLDNLPGWVQEASRRDRVPLAVHYGGIDHAAEIESLTLMAAAAPFYQRIASKLRALYRAEDTPAIQVSDRVARLPGLADMLTARIGGEVFALEPGATARGALARYREGAAPGEAVRLKRQLPWDRKAAEVSREARARRHTGIPTHLLFGSKGYAIDEAPLVVGTQADGERAIVVGADMPGVSRRHCTLRFLNGRAVLEDHSRYGTFLNGHRIDGSTVLEVGDTVRVGSPGYEFRLITTDEAHGT